MAHFELPNLAPDADHWGPPRGASATGVLPQEFQQIPFAPFSKVCAPRISR